MAGSLAWVTLMMFCEVRRLHLSCLVDSRSLKLSEKDWLFYHHKYKTVKEF